MTTFTITITDASQLAGITAARNAYNASIPATVDDPANPGTQIANPELLTTDQDYMQFVNSSAAASYKSQYNT